LKFTGLLDFSTYKKVSEGTSGVKINVSDNSFSEKIKNRDEIPILYDGLKTIDDAAITAFTPEYIDLLLYGIETKTDAGMLIFPEAYTTGFLQYVIGLSLGTDNSEYYSVTSGGSNNIQEESNYFFKANVLGTGILSGTLHFYLNNGGGSFKIVCGKYNAGSLVEAYEITDFAFPVSGSITFNEEFTKDVTFVAGDYFKFYAFFGIGGGGNIEFYETTVNFNTVEKFQETTCQAVLPANAFNRVLESITGVASALDSTFVSALNLAFTNGFLLRQFPNTKAQLTFSLKDLFRAIEIPYCLGAGVEGSTFVIREKKDFFQTNVVLDITNMQLDSFALQYDPNLFYNEIEIGYAKAAYEEIAGLEEYNNKTSWATALKSIKKKLELINDYRADGTGIEFARREFYEKDNNKDTEYDRDNFMIETVLDTTYKQRTDEDFDSVTGIDHITTPFNLNLTPARTLRRWGWMLQSGLQKILDTKVKYMTADFVTDLATKRTDESVIIYENTDVPVSELEGAVLSGFKVMFKAPASFQNILDLESDPYGLVTYINPITKIQEYGWLKEVSTNPVDKITTWELWQAKQAYVVISYWITENEIFLTTQDGKLFIIQ